MLTRIIIFLIALIFIPMGWQEITIAYKYSEPVKMKCQDLINAADKPEWVSVDDCVVYFGQYEFGKSQKTGDVKSMAVMVFPSMAAASDESAKTSLVLDINDSNQRASIITNLEQANALAKNSDPAKAAERDAKIQKLYSSASMILKIAPVNEDYKLLGDRLNPVHATYRYSSLADKSSILTGVLMILGALVVCAGVVFSFVSGSKKQTQRPTEKPAHKVQ